jgi:hypothetical protein
MLEHCFPVPHSDGGINAPELQNCLGCVVGGGVSQADHRIGLRTLLALNDVEFNVIALFQSFVAIQLDCRVVNENIWPVVTSDESVALGVIEPLDLAYVLSHRGLPFLPLEG